jgi:eukaryotic translation initiation factor 2C
LPKDEIEKTVQVTQGEGNSRDFKITVKLAATIDLSILKNYQRPENATSDKPSQAMQCLDVVLRSVFKSEQRQRGIEVGRAIYYQSNSNNPRDYDLEMGYELYLGLFQAAVMGRKHLYLNVDVCHKAFPGAMGMTVVEAMNRYFSYQGRFNKIEFGQYLKMLDIEYVFNGQSKFYRCNGLVEAANKQTFNLDDGSQQTVVQYFQTQYNYQLSRPDLPCLHVGPTVRSIYLPMEFCRIPAGQAKNFKVPAKCNDKLIRMAATPTMMRKSKIIGLLRNVDYERTQIIGEFGLDVGKDFE